MVTDSSGRKRQFSKRKRRRDIKPLVESEIRDKAVFGGRTAADIFRFLQQRAKNEKWDENDVPSIRTIQRVVRELKIEQEMSPWTLKDAVDEGARHLLDALKGVIMLSDGRKSVLTREEAEWVLRLRRARPEMPPLLAWMLARFYMLYEAKGTDTRALDAYLAFEPWGRDKDDFGRFRTYCTAVVNKWIPSAPFDILRYLLPSDTAWILAKDRDARLRRLVDGTMTLFELEDLLKKVTVVMPEPVLDDEQPGDWDIDD